MQTLQTMGSTVFGFRHELWEGVEDDGMPHSQGFWRVAITAYMNIVKIIYEYSQCAEVSLVCFFMRYASLVYHSWPLGQPPGRISPIESGTWWPFWFRHHDFSSCLSPALLGLTSVLAVLPNDSPAVHSSLRMLLRNDLLTHWIKSRISLPSFLQGFLFVHTPMQMVPSLLSALSLVSFCTHTFCWS